MSTSAEKSATPLLALVGQPNCGKTTLFNALTGQSQQVGNYPGVTVEKKTGVLYTTHGRKVCLLDLPGTYSLVPASPDERVTRDALLGGIEGLALPDLVLCVLDAANLERCLNFALEVIDLGLPTLVVLNRVDLAEAEGVRFDLSILAEMLGVPVLPCQANDRSRVLDVKQAIGRPLPHVSGRQWRADAELEKLVSRLENRFAKMGCTLPLGRAQICVVDANFRQEMQTDLGESDCNEGHMEELSGNLQLARRSRADEIFRHSVTSSGDGSLWKLTDRLDRVLVHPVWGWLFFIPLMILMFVGLFVVAEPMIGAVEFGFESLGGWVSDMMAEGDLRDLLVDGVIAGVGGVLVFLPQILLLFLFIGILESCGYMARAAYLMDGLMSQAGLSGRAFIPLLSSYACAIPGIMGTRTIDNARERLVTILVAPWMSCNARLPVYVLLIAVIFQDQDNSWLKGLVLFGLYALGTLGVFLAAAIFSRKFSGGERSHFMLELPTYRRPDFGFISRQLWDRGMAFVKKAGTLIMGFSILLWFLQTYPKQDGGESALDQSYLGRSGQLIEPVMKPLGYDWRISVSVLSSFAAREVFASSVAVIFGGDEELVEDEAELLPALDRATWPDGEKLFSLPTCSSLLVFYIFALQCLPTVATTQRETGSWKWAGFQFGYMTLFAYLAALVTYQLCASIL